MPVSEHWKQEEQILIVSFTAILFLHLLHLIFVLYKFNLICFKPSLEKKMNIFLVLNIDYKEKMTF